MIRLIAICIVCGCLMRLAGFVAFAWAPALRTVLPVIKPPTSITITSAFPAVVYVSPDLREPFSPLTGWSTNRTVVPAVAAQMFYSAIASNFPLTNQPVVVSWRTVAEAVSYRIYFGDSGTNWLQQIETVNRTQLTTKLWKCFETNTVAMTAINSNGVESVMSKVYKFKPELRLSITKN